MIMLKILPQSILYWQISQLPLPLSSDYFFKTELCTKQVHIDTISVPKGFTLQLGKREIEKPMCDHPYCPKLAYISKGIWHGVLTYINQVDTLNIQTLPCQKDYFSLGGGGRGGAVLST